MPSQRFVPGYSRVHFYTLVVVHLFAWICICMIATMIVDGVCAIGIGLSFCYFLQHETIRSVEYLQKTEWLLTLDDDNIVQGELLPSSVMMPYFVVMHFRVADANRKIHLFFFCDHFSKIEYIALRRSMKMGYL